MVYLIYTIQKKIKNKMAIHTKVGILTHVPGSSASVTPGLIGGIYADFLTKEFDFLDDSRMYPQDVWFTNSAWEYTNHATGDWEDIATTYRAWRDEYTMAQNEYWLTREYRNPFQYKNFVKDPSGTGTLNPLEWIRLVYPAPNGDFNMPYPNPKWSEAYSFQNSSYPLRHNMTRLTLPLASMAWQSARASGSEEILENQQWIRNNAEAIKVKQSEVDALAISFQQAFDAYSARSDEVQNLINSGSDQSLIDAAQAELDILSANEVLLKDQKNAANQELNDLYNNSQWVMPNTFAGRNEKYRANRDTFFKTMNELALGGNLSSQSGYVLGVYKESFTEEDLAAMRAAFLDHNFFDNSPNPWNDEVYRFAWADGVNPVEGAQNSTIHQGIGGDWGQNTMTNHPLGTMPFEVLPGVTKINRLPAVANASLLPAVGNPGDVIRVLSGGDEYAWDPQNQEWSVGFYTRFLGTFDDRMRSIRDAKLKAKNELSLAMKPFTFASLHIPSFCLSTSNEIVK